MADVISLHSKQNGVRLPIGDDMTSLDDTALFKRFASIGWGLGIDDHCYVLVNDLEWTFHLYPEGAHWRIWAETAEEQQAGVDAVRGVLDLKLPPHSF